LSIDPEIGASTVPEATTPPIAEAKPLTAADVEAIVARMLTLTDVSGHPMTSPLSVALRDAKHAYWNSKVLGSFLARQLYAEAQAAGSAPPTSAPVQVGLQGRLCRQADIESDWLRHWCRVLGMQPVYHRKIWEDSFVPQAIWEAGLLKPGARALGFAVGTEVMPSFLAASGVEVLATDLVSDDSRALGWQSTNQHAGSLRDIFKPDLISEADFQRLVNFRPLNMNEVPTELYGQFDICWSICSFEHLGSIKKGLAFVENSVRCLKPGGIAVHTTEFNLQNDYETIDNWGTVIFQRKHFEELGKKLAQDGHQLLPIDYSAGGGVLDQFVDLPPFQHQEIPLLHYPEPPHLRVSIDGFVATSIGIIVRAGG